MLTRAQEKTIRSLHTKKGRKETNLCLVEGQKNVEAAGTYVEYTFTSRDSAKFMSLLTTETPQEVAAVARIPAFTFDDIKEKSLIIVLDGVQDPGNIGSILRLAHGFHAGVVLVNSADPSNPKVIRSSVGSLFHAPWVAVSRQEAAQFIANEKRPVFRLERSEEAVSVSKLSQQCIIIAGAEGFGITLDIKAPSLIIHHDPSLESLNVGHALAIAMHSHFSQNL